MNIQNQINRLRLSCPDPADVESILLKSHKHPVLIKAFEDHLVGCERCCKRVKRMQIFYEILQDEMARPASVKVVEFAEELYLESHL